MKRMGIDYGSKRVGIALSDDGGTMAFPKTVLPAGPDLVPTLEKMIRAEKVEEIVLGESKDFSQNENPIMIEVHAFKVQIEKAASIPVHFEPELMTSREAQHIQGNNDMNDASAAAIILQSYINRHTHDH